MEAINDTMRVRMRLLKENGYNVEAAQNLGFEYILG